MSSLSSKDGLFEIGEYGENSAFSRDYEISSESSSTVRTGTVKDSQSNLKLTITRSIKSKDKDSEMELPLTMEVQKSKLKDNEFLKMYNMKGGIHEADREKADNLVKNI